MSDSVLKYHLKFASTIEPHVIHAVIWSAAPLEKGTPAQVKGVVQLVHGMAEYIERYDEFAEYLVSQGYLVCGHDHIAHGQSALSKHELGDIPADGGKEALIEDVHLLRQIMADYITDETPYILFGHSMGSFVVRAYLARHGLGLAGAIVCGTGMQPYKVAKLGSKLAHRGAKRMGNSYKSKFLYNMADGSYAKKIEKAKTSLDWLSVNEENVATYDADEYCGFMFTVGGYAALMDLLMEIAEPNCLPDTPHFMPLLLTAGLEDPVGENGAAVTELYKQMKAENLNVTLRLYPGMRHEILNETNKQEVFQELAQWIEGCVS